MNDIDFVKWMVDKAGWRLQFDGLKYLIWCGDVNTSLTTSYFKLVFYPLLLQKVIEGINKKTNNLDMGYWIVQDASTIEIYQNNYVTFEECFSIDYDKPNQAKIAALKYIYGQEKK